MIKRLYWRLFIAKLSLRWISIPGIGRMVWWRGEKWMLIQGVADPYWDLVRGNKREGGIHVGQFSLVQNPVEWVLAFRRGYQFYMGSWYDIWAREGIKPWMRGCHIWGRRRNAEGKVDRLRREAGQ